tara:strand:- start:454093 stop:454392 length:300 start_codon:yes stop_codon:yes gene_type:complete
VCIVVFYRDRRQPPKGVDFQGEHAGSNIPAQLPERDDSITTIYTRHLRRDRPDRVSRFQLAGNRCGLDAAKSVNAWIAGDKNRWQDVREAPPAVVDDQA